MILFTERFRADKLFQRWAEKYRAAKCPMNVIAWLLPVIDEEKFKEFIKEQEKELSEKEEQYIRNDVLVMKETREIAFKKEGDLSDED